MAGRWCNSPSGPRCNMAPGPLHALAQEVQVTADDNLGRLDDDYPAYTTGRAAEILNTTQGFLRAIGEARLITPLRSAGGHPATPATSSASSPAPGNSSTGAPPSRQPAESSPSKTSSRKHSASTPNTTTPVKPAALSAEHVGRHCRYQA